MNNKKYSWMVLVVMLMTLAAACSIAAPKVLTTEADRQVRPTKVLWRASNLSMQWWEVRPEQGFDDAATCVMPGTDYYQGVSILSTTQAGYTGDLSGTNIGVGFYIQIEGGAPVEWLPDYETWTASAPSDYEPGTVRIFFTTAPGIYNFEAGNERPTEYWWCVADSGSFDIGLEAGAILTASLSDPSQWVDALGEPGTEHAEEFFEACRKVAQVGLSFGVHYFDNGVRPGTTPGGKGHATATLHLQNLATF